MTQWTKLALGLALTLWLAAPAWADEDGSGDEESTEEAPAETPAEKPAEDETPAEKPAEGPAEAPAETPAEAPAETPAATPAEQPADVPKTAEVTQLEAIFERDLGKTWHAYQASPEKARGVAFTEFVLAHRQADDYAEYQAASPAGASFAAFTLERLESRRDVGIGLTASGLAVFAGSIFAYWGVRATLCADEPTGSDARHDCQHDTLIGASVGIAAGTLVTVAGSILWQANGPEAARVERLVQRDGVGGPPAVALTGLTPLLGHTGRPRGAALSLSF